MRILHTTDLPQTQLLVHQQVLYYELNVTKESYL